MKTPHAGDWYSQIAAERNAREDREIRRDLLARIEAGEKSLRGSLPPRRWDSTNSDRGITLHVSAFSSSERKITMINPTCRKGSSGSFVLWFGGCGATYLHVFADGLDDALETCAAWLLLHGPGHVMKEWGTEHTELVREACEERGLVYPPANNVDLDHEGYYEAQADAEIDLTRTESGFLTSYEWGISLEDPTTEELYNFLWCDQ